MENTTNTQTPRGTARVHHYLDGRIVCGAPTNGYSAMSADPAAVTCRACRDALAIAKLEGLSDEELIALEREHRADAIVLREACIATRAAGKDATELGAEYDHVVHARLVDTQTAIVARGLARKRAFTRRSDAGELEAARERRAEVSR